VTAGPERAQSAWDARPVPEPRSGPRGGRTGGQPVAGPDPAVPHQRVPQLPPGPPPRPRIVPEPSILGLSRLARSRFGSRLFTLFFVFVYVLIVVQMVYAILDSPW
jgi:hypothetical protein